MNILSKEKSISQILMAKNKNKVEILFEDESIVVVNKPAGVLSIPDRFKPELPNLKNLLLQDREVIIPVHRLDKFTSGIIIFAKTPEAHRDLSNQWQGKKVDKTYLAFVQGIPNNETGSIDKPIASDPSRPGKMKINRNGKQAVSHYKVLEVYQDIALVEVKIETGRTHQIRVHLRSIGHPLLVDKDYAKKEAWYLSSFKGKKFSKGKAEEERPLLSRLSLHAKTLVFKNPSTQEEQVLTAEFPKDLRALSKQLEKWNKK